MQLTVTSNFPAIQKALNQLRSDIRDRALVSAINKTLDQAQTQMVRSITGEFAVTAGYVRQRLRIRRAVARGTAVTLEGSLIGSTGKRSANIIAFVERVTTLAAGRKRAKLGTRNLLYVRIKRGGTAVPLPGAFIGNDGRTVFERVGKSRLPIRPVQVIDVPQMFNTRRISSVVVKFMQDKFPAIFDHEAKFFTDRFNRGSAR